MIVWEMFGVWALGCFLWHERRAVIQAALAGAVFGVVLGVVYTTGTVVFGSWWWLILIPWALVAWQILCGETMIPGLRSFLALMMMVTASLYSGTVWQTMDGLFAMLRGGLG